MNLINQTTQNSNTLSQFMDFYNNFTGNPQEELDKLLSSGKYTTEQIENAKRQAKQLEPLVSNMIKR